MSQEKNTSTPVQNGNNNTKFVDKHSIPMPKHKQISILEKTYTTQNGYKVSPKNSPAPKTTIIDKVTIDYHLENFIMNRKIALNGGNEIRIDEKNISLHLNNPFVTTFSSQHLQKQENCDGPKNALHNGSSLPHPKRPHSIAIEPQLQRMKGNEENPNLKINSDDAKQREPLYNVPYSSFQKFNDHGSISSPVGHVKSDTGPRMPPAIPQRRSQSIPRQTATNCISTLPVLRPRSLDRNTPMAQQMNYNMKRFSQSGLQNVRDPNGIGMRQSATFHGQPLDPGVIYSNMHEMTAKNIGSIDRKQTRPVSFAYGTVPDQALLEKQLRIYSEQLRTITESVKRYSEQAKLLQELKKQKQQKSNNLSLAQPSQTQSGLQPLHVPSPRDGTNEEVQTPSHQLKLFLESIRSSMRQPECNGELLNDEEENKTKFENGKSDRTLIETIDPRVENPSTDSKTHSDQLHQFLDAIRSNQHETCRVDIKHSNSDNRPLKPLDDVTSSNGTAVAEEKESKNNTVGMLVSSINKSQSLNEENQEKLAINIAKTSRTVDQILDKFHLLAMNAKSADSVEYLKKCSDALKQTSEQIRLFDMAYGARNENSFNGTGTLSNSSEDSSCSTTPGSIREAVQSLLLQPRNGFQIMDDRMALFIDILDTQDKFSQVIILIITYIFATKQSG